MIYDFLDKETKRLEEELNEDKKALSELQIKKQENKKFVQVLKDTIEHKCAGFTPYEVTKEEERKIEELKKENAIIEEQIMELENSIFEQESMLSEYKKIAEMAKDLEDKYK